MADAFIGEIRALPYSFVPQGWMLCDGSLHSIQTYVPLHAVIGYLYGGSPQSGQFGVPDLRSRVVVGLGTDLISGFALGQGNKSGHATVSSPLPLHSHTLNGKMGPHIQSVNTPANNWLGVPTYQTPNSTPKTQQGKRYEVPPGTHDVHLNSRTLGTAGVSTPQAHENCQPYQTVAYFICSEGTWPSRP
ncbi:phage tail protein [Novispirillum itersonii]|uniref:Microcystin-dependent protein n=1 Tax=Novispirillum itersonii TaxID=189 RepID=A0A7W9ZHL4_NOVIT|nr:tail fiber protein [Novispirillum itersonii]MBB6210249.1 microcystin-dependent protein [Novispirillum itersonii]